MTLRQNEDPSLLVVHEDERLIAVSKPAGQLVIPGRGETDVRPLCQQVEARAGQRVFVVHRLDRDASGLVVFAKDAATHRSLSLSFEKRDVRKTYWVVVKGQMTEGGRIDKPLHAFGSGRMGIDSRGKPSLTEYRIKRNFLNSTWLEVEPHTGRRHQIRVHFYSLGHPVLGDVYYGLERPVEGVSRLMLHARGLVLPMEGSSPLEISTEPPEDFMQIIEKLNGGR